MKLIQETFDSGESLVDVSIVVPCYRSGAWLRALVGRIAAALEPLDLTFEVLLINDASPDNTWPVICGLAADYPFVRGFDMLFNVGQFRGTICGFEHARGALIVTIDDDLQHPPEEIPALVTAICNHPEIDCVIGAYRDGKRHNLIRNFGSAVWSRMNELLYFKPRELRMTSFRIMRRQVAEAICAHGTSKPIVGPLLMRSTRRIMNVPVAHHPRQAGRSGYSLRRMLRLTLDNLISGSTLPLKLVSSLGLLSATASFCLGCYYFVQYIRGAVAVPGFATLVLLITFFGGLTLLSIGILGEYVIRIIHEVGRPPRYVVRGTTASGATTALSAPSDAAETVPMLNGPAIPAGHGF